MWKRVLGTLLFLSVGFIMEAPFGMDEEFMGIIVSVVGTALVYVFYLLFTIAPALISVPILLILVGITTWVLWKHRKSEEEEKMKHELQRKEMERSFHLSRQEGDVGIELGRLKEEEKEEKEEEEETGHFQIVNHEVQL